MLIFRNSPLLWRVNVSKPFPRPSLPPLVHSGPSPQTLHITFTDGRKEMDNGRHRGKYISIFPIRILTSFEQHPLWFPLLKKRTNSLSKPKTDYIHWSVTLCFLPRSDFLFGCRSGSGRAYRSLHKTRPVVNCSILKVNKKEKFLAPIL